MQGASPLASPGAEPARHWFALPLLKTQWGGLPRRCRRGGCQRYPAGGVPALPPANPAISLLFRPSPSPLPGGKGEIFCFLMQGASPLASPGLNPRDTGSPCRCGKLNGGLPRRCRRGGRQRYPAGGCARFVACLPCLNLLSCPYPPSPLPGGKGVTIGYFLQGAAPLAFPGLNPRGTGSPCRCGKLNGGLASALPARRASAVPGGGRACFAACLPCHCGARGGRVGFGRLLTLPLDFFSAPIPPPPLPRWGRGRFLLSYARGCAPCIPGAEPARHWFALPLWKTQWGACPGVAGAAGVSGTRRGGVPALSPAYTATVVPGGGVPALLPAYTAFSFVFLPLSPRPPSRREGGDFLFSYARGCAPCIPGAEPARHWLCLWETGSLGFVVAPAPAGATGTRVVKTNCPRGTCMAETVSAASGLMPGCRGR